MQHEETGGAGFNLRLRQLNIDVCVMLIHFLLNSQYSQWSIELYSSG